MNITHRGFGRLLDDSTLTSVLVARTAIGQPH